MEKLENTPANSVAVSLANIWLKDWHSGDKLSDERRVVLDACKIDPSLTAAVVARLMLFDKRPNCESAYAFARHAEFYFREPY